MKTKEKQPLTNKWERIFKVWPVKTEDGYRVMLGRVYRMVTDDPFEPVRYHTNPHGDGLKELTDKVDEFLDLRLSNEQEELKEQLNKMRQLAAGLKRVGPPRKRPPPPPPPPRPRRIGGGDITYHDITNAWGLEKRNAQREALRRIMEKNKRKL